MAINTAHDIVSTSPTNVFAAPLLAANITLSDGNLKCAATQEVWDGVTSSISVKSGKYYYEYLVVHSGNLNRIMMGLANLTGEYTKHFDGKGVSGDPASDISDNPLWVKMTWTNYHANTTTYTGDSTAVANDEILGIFFDLDSSPPTIKYYHNGTLKQSFDLVADKFYTPIALLNQNSSSSNAVIFNFGIDSSFGGNKTSGSANATDSGGIGDFYYKPVTSGTYSSSDESNVVSEFRALCTANIQSSLAIDPAVDNLPEDFFKCLIWTANNLNTRSIPHNMTNAPDLIWIKNRSSSTASPTIFDSVRNFGTNELISSHTSSEGSYASDYGYVNSVDSTNINLSAGSASGDISKDYVNRETNEYVGWVWAAGGSPTADNTATSGAMTANSVSVDGTLQSSYTPSGSPTIYPKRMSVGTKQGFSIVKYAGNITSGSATIPHGLNGCDFCLIKNLDNANAWIVSHKSIVPNVVCLNGSGAAGSTPPIDGPYGSITQLGSSTITLTSGTSGIDNVAKGGSNWEYIAYCWHSVEGYSAFGSVANLNNDEFVYLGFKPAWVMFKRTTDTSSWLIYDNVRNSHNVCDKILRADTSGNETTYASLDLLSNGFKARSFSGVSGEWVYMAFAEMSQKFANAR